MRKCMIYAVIGLFLLPLYGMAKKRSPKEERTNNHSAFLYYREFGPSVIKGFVYLFFDTLNRSFVLMESNHLGSSDAEYGACRINGDTLVLTPFICSSTFLYLTDYIRENTNLDDEQIEKELDLLGENNSSDTIRSLYDEWCSLRFKPIDVPVFRSKEESINFCPDKFSEYRYIMKGRKLINITAKEIKYRQHNIFLQDLYKVDLPIPPEKEVFSSWLSCIIALFILPLLPGCSPFVCPLLAPWVPGCSPSCLPIGSAGDWKKSYFSTVITEYLFVVLIVSSFVRVSLPRAVLTSLVVSPVSSASFATDVSLCPR